MGPAHCGSRKLRHDRLSTDIAGSVLHRLPDKSERVHQRVLQDDRTMLQILHA